MNILVTGGAGYIGTELIRQLVLMPEVEQVILYDNLSRGNYNIFLHSGIKRGKVKFVKGELLDSRTLKNVVKDVDIVYHLAARVSTPLSNESSHLFEQVNHWGTAELVYAVEESKVKKFVYLSSASVYGASSEEMTIDSTPNPQSFYGISKYRGEQHVLRLMNKIPTYILRCGNVYGYGISMRFDAVINRFMFDASFNGRINIYGDGMQRRSFIYIDKITEILNRLIYSDLKPGIYNAVDRVMPILEVASAIQELYPDMEMLYINQHMKMRELVVKPDENILSLAQTSKLTFKQELEQIMKRFHDSSPL
ncbi:MAG: SDR family oxidoreductase [Bacteroidales bacterium]|nr:SDR family oxidoreductase [Bacteroidales bacterium]